MLQQLLVVLARLHVGRQSVTGADTVPCDSIRRYSVFRPGRNCTGITWLRWAMAREA